MSQKKMKQFRREFRKTHGTGGKTSELEVNFRNVMKVVTLSEERRALKNMLAENRRLSKDKRRGFFEILADAPKAGKQYIKKTQRVLADEKRRQYQHDKKLFRYGHL